jgi:SAM-dependent methyltransferase
MQKEDTPSENNVLKDEKYLSTIYSEERRPINDYPLKLATHLRDKYYYGTGNLLDIGCGRGDFLKAFHNLEFSVSGTDISPSSIETCKPHLVKTSNLEMEPLPFSEGEFNFVFSKSVIEHLHNPMPFLQEALRVLDSDGKAVIMTPSWIHHGWGPFYLDYTHVTPFTRPSLIDAMEMAGFKNVEVFHFHQLPFLWKNPSLKPLVRFFASLPLPYRPLYDTSIPAGLNKLIQFSKEVMLLGVGEKT